MKSLVVLMVLASSASGALILDHPEPTGTASSAVQPEPASWPSQKFSVDKPTSITQVEVHVRRLEGTASPSVVLFTDDGGNPGDKGRSIPKDRLFTSVLPVPSEDIGNFTWRSTGDLENWFIDPGTYWLAVTSEPPPEDGLFRGTVSRTDDPAFAVADSRATYAGKPLFNEEGELVDTLFSWGVVGPASGLSIRIHGEAVPEPGTATLLLIGLFATELVGFRSVRRHRR